LTTLIPENNNQMENLVDTIILGAVGTAVFPIAFLVARMCLAGLVRALPAKAAVSQLSGSSVLIGD
jgi:hypothetical protein